MMLGDILISKRSFAQIDAVIDSFHTAEFKQLSYQEKNRCVCQTLLEAILQEDPSHFALLPLSDYIDRVISEGILPDFSFFQFERWLTQDSGLSSKENRYVRGKIAGRWIPRHRYQKLFPIGMTHTFTGPHFITAHASPDVDTTIASFWGWLDAFAAVLTQDSHIWNVPTHQELAYLEIDLLFRSAFGKALFSYLADHQSALEIKAKHIASKQQVMWLDFHDRLAPVFPVEGKNIVVIENRYSYVGHLTKQQFLVTQPFVLIISQLIECYLHLAKQQISSLLLSDSDVEDSQIDMTSTYQMTVSDVIATVQSIDIDEKTVTRILRDVCEVPAGRPLLMADLVHLCVKQSGSQSNPCSHDLTPSLTKNQDEARTFLEKIKITVHFVHTAQFYFLIKEEVCGKDGNLLTPDASIEEVKNALQKTPTVLIHQIHEDQTTSILGAVSRDLLLQKSLGTVSLRDFSNCEETKIPSYLAVISAFDHHKSSLKTSMASTLWITDAQSCNTLVAEISLQLSEDYSTGGMGLDEVQKQIEEVTSHLFTPSDYRILQRLLKKQLILIQKNPYFVSVEREITECLHYLYAILDDTDLLSKATYQDVIVIMNLLNKLKSLQLKKEVEIIHFDHILEDGDFVKNAVKHILQNAEMYSLYKKLYDLKEKLINDQMTLASQGCASSLWNDTKEQNGCCRVGQTKIFHRNYAHFNQVVQALSYEWQRLSDQFYQQKKEVDLYLQMISTVKGCDEAYEGKEMHYTHRDELWIWNAPTEQAFSHLKTFLEGFLASPIVSKLSIEIEPLDEVTNRFLQTEFPSLSLASIKNISHLESKGMILRYKAGSLNSRKAVISPYLPHI